MKITIAGLWSAFFALDSLSSTRVLAQFVETVEYTFNDASDPTKNTGDGGNPPSNLDGVLRGSGVSFVDGQGRHGSTVANFTGHGCIQVPSSVEINRGPTGSRMVSLDFKWDGTKRGNTNPQVLFEQGYDNGLNIYLRTKDTNDNAELNMAAWMIPVSSYGLSFRTNYDIVADTWYTARLELDATAGTFSGYLDDVQFGSTDIDFLPIPYSGTNYRNGLGGMFDRTVIFNPSGRDKHLSGSGLYFNGQIDNFRIRNPRFPSVVEYAFTDTSNRYRNTGNGGSSSASSLNGIPKPSDNDIAFDGLQAVFTRDGCIQVPTDSNVNGPSGGVGDRTISLRFKWGGSNSNRRQPQILWEEGGRDSGINMYLYPLNNRRKAAFLVMAVWEKSSSVLVSGVVQKRTIHADAWYHATMVLDRNGTSKFGTLTGYLDTVQFQQKEIDFFRIEQHNGDNCLGGMKQNTRVFATDDSGASAGLDGNGFYFKGYVDKFRLINRAEHPVPPTPSPTVAPTIDELMVVVQYTFDNPTDRMGNTGDGDPSLTSLDGILVPASESGISFLETDEGNGFASFTGTGCIQVPTSNEINGGFDDRTIALNFLWDGTSTTDPQILFEEGSQSGGVNIYLQSLSQGTAELVMAVWETNQGVRVSEFVSEMIQAGTWYQGSLVLDRDQRTSNGLLQGYLNGEEFAQVAIDFFGINQHNSDNCLGGMKSNTFIVASADASSPSDGFYFHGLIDDFRLYNSVQYPGIWVAPPAPTPSPSMTPTAVPSGVPSVAPTNAPSEVPSESPTSPPSLSSAPSEEPSNGPSSSAEPSIEPSSQPSQSLMPSVTPSNEATSWPSAGPSGGPSSMPSTTPGIWVNITYDDFESLGEADNGWGNFADGGTGPDDAVRYTDPTYPTFAHQGVAALRIRGVPDGSDSVSSVLLANDYNVTIYSKLRVSFWYFPWRLEAGDAFRLEYSSDGNATWTTVKELVVGQDFADGSFHFAAVDFDSTGALQARIRFRCIADGRRDWVYIDEVLFQGFQRM